MKKRICLLLCSFFAVYLVNFFIPYAMPGDPFRYNAATASEAFDVQYTQQQLDAMRAHYGLDLPLGTQFIRATTRLAQGDFGESIYYKKPVGTVLATHLPWTLCIMALALCTSLVLGAGIALCGVRGGKWDAFWFRLFSIIGEIPSFLIAVGLLFCVAANVPWLPLAGGETPFVFSQTIWQRIGDLLVHGILPVLALTLVLTPQFYFTARTEFASVLRQPYVQAATLKGLPEVKIRVQYILRNASDALWMRFFLSCGTAVSGTMLIETVFAYPGIGTVLRNAVAVRDYPMVQGVFLVSCVLVLLCVFIADTLQAKRGVA